jgi:phospholipid transport system transporter-binding protein
MTSNTIMLPTRLTHGEVSTLWRDTQAKLGHTTTVDASHLKHFDSSALALLVHYANRGLSLENVPQRVTELAKLYGVYSLLKLSEQKVVETVDIK